MKPRRLALYSAPIFLFLAAALILGTILLQDDSKSLALAKYRAIRSGMTPREVDRLMRDGRHVQGGELGIAQVYHVDRRYFIGVVYGPNPNRPAAAKRPHWPLPNDWVVKEKTFIELGRGRGADPLLIEWGLKAQPVRGHELVP